MDTIADLLTRIRNANMKLKSWTDIPHSKLKHEILRILKEDGFIANFKVAHGSPQGYLRVFLKYTPDGERVLRGLKRVSKPGRRMYRSSKDIPRLRGGFGVTIVSTSRGVLRDREAREKNVGGEVLCQVW